MPHFKSFENVKRITQQIKMFIKLDLYNEKFTPSKGTFVSL